MAAKAYEKTRQVIRIMQPEHYLDIEDKSALKAILER